MVKPKAWRDELRSQQVQLAAFEGEKFFLDGQPAAVSGELAVRSNDAMAGNDDRNGIGTVCQAHGARGVRVADASGQLAVGDGLAVGDLAKLLPDSLLKGGALGREREVKGFKVSGEIGAELANGLCESR